MNYSIAKNAKLSNERLLVLKYHKVVQFRDVPICIKDKGRFTTASASCDPFHGCGPALDKNTRAQEETDFFFKIAQNLAHGNVGINLWKSRKGHYLIGLTRLGYGN